MDDYLEFLKAKVAKAERYGFDISTDEVNPILKPHQKASVAWAVQGGRRALFESFGLGKTMMQLEVVRLTRKRAGGMGLIVMPLGVRQEFLRDAHMLDIPVKSIRRIEEADDPNGIYLTNYETIREGKLDPRHFSVASLDEASVLRGFGGVKTFREFMALFAGDRKTLNERSLSGGVPYRFVATATPSPNDYIELLAYSAYLGILDVSAAKTRFFKRDSTKADHLTLHPHRAEEFWLWVSTWALFVQKPSDLGFDDTGYILPEMHVHWHEVETDHSKAGHEKNGQVRMFANAARGVQDSAREKRASMERRIERLREIINGMREGSGARSLSDQLVIWCDLNDEQRAVEKMLKEEGISFSSLYGSQDIEKREELLEKWRRRETTVFLSKCLMYGAGVNLQQCHTMIYLGVDFKFYQVFQGIHRIHRFLQSRSCEIHFIYTQAERLIRKNLETKWSKHNEMVGKMAEIIKQYGLSMAGMAEHLTRAMGVERVEASGKRYRMVNNDCIPETRSMEENSVGLILTSIPFCYDEKTEILTKDGWKNFKDLIDGDEVGTVNPEKLSFEWQKPTNRIWQPYEGEMICFGNRICDLVVTPNHRMLVARRGNDFNVNSFKLLSAEEITREYETISRKSLSDGRILRAWRTCVIPPNPGVGERPERINIPPLPNHIKNGHGVEIYWIGAEDFMRLVGWYLSEGHADACEMGRQFGRISIAQVDGRKLKGRSGEGLLIAQAKSNELRQEICDIFVRIGLPPSIHSRQITVWCRNLAYFLIKEFGSGSKNKHIPAWVLNMHPELLTILRDTMMKGDGSRDGTAYTSFSQELRDDFQEICIKTGWQACIKGNFVHIATKQIYPEIRQAPKRIKYSGMIGCATVPNGLLVVRRNGKPCVSGNSSQYEYSPNYADMGHSDNNAHFWQQMDYLIPELFRVLQPGRIAAIHVKDRIVPGGMTGLGFQTVYPFHMDCHAHFAAAGFGYMGMKTIVTDVVRENNQTYRLGWTEQCKDGTKMGVGMPEYLLLFRKPPTDTTDGYADLPVVKTKEKYSRSRWQIDAHGFARSSGDRLMNPEELRQLKHDEIFKLFRDYSLTRIYDFEHHVKIGETLDVQGRLPVTFMLLQPQSWSPDVWTDITRMLTLNGAQSAAGKQMHLCPMQFDLADRVIEQFSMEDEVVFDPFAGIGTVPYRAILKKRFGLGCELSTPYFLDACGYCKMADQDVASPTIFDLIREEKQRITEDEQARRGAFRHPQADADRSASRAQQPRWRTAGPVCPVSPADGCQASCAESEKQRTDVDGGHGAMKPLPIDIYDQHINLVKYHAARCISRFGAPADFKDDLVQEGCIGLIRAWQTFDPNKGKFSTYSSPWILLYQARFVRENMSIVRPTRYNAGLTRGQVVALTKRDLSTFEPVTNKGTVGDLIPDPSDPVDAIIEREELRSLIREVAYSFAWNEQELLVLEGRLLAWPEDRVKNREMAERFRQATSTSRMREARMIRMIGERIAKMMEGTG